MVACDFEGHKGHLNPDNNRVKFYGLSFTTITEAIKLLKHLDTCYKYKPFVFRSKCGVINEDGYVMILDNNRPIWLTSKQEAKKWIKDSNQLLIRNGFQSKKNKSRRDLTSTWF